MTYLALHHHHEVNAWLSPHEADMKQLDEDIEAATVFRRVYQPRH